MNKLLFTSAIMAFIVIVIALIAGSAIVGNVILPTDIVREGWEEAVFFSTVYLVFLMMYSLVGFLFENIKDGKSNKYRDLRFGKRKTKEGKIRKNSRKRHQ